MKQILLIAILSMLVIGCGPLISPPNLANDLENPYKEYRIKDIAVSKTIEDGILEQEANKYGFDLETTSAHVISMTKYGDYFEGTLKIMGSLSKDRLEEIEKSSLKNYNKQGIMSYECTFEYSAKTGFYLWRSLYSSPL